MVRLNYLATLLSLPLAAIALSKTPLTLQELRKQVKGGAQRLNERQTETAAASKYPAYNISVPIDHFHNDSFYEPHSDGFYNMRYWFDAQNYKPGGPVIVLCAGETSGVGRLPFLEKGIVAQLTQATNGIGVILEHRYYGESWPVKDLSTPNMRFLTTDQALADTAYFAQHVKFEGLEHLDLTSATTAYIAYGGSYAGAFVAFLRKLYPETYWGAISSSGVTEAIWDYWKYFEAAAKFAPAGCAETTQKMTNVVDNILLAKMKDTKLVGQIKQVFGLPNVTADADFASAINQGIYSLQSYNWDPKESEDTFFVYCANVTSDSVLYPATEPLRERVVELIEAGGWGNESETLTNRMLNYIGYVRGETVATCENEDQDQCFATANGAVGGEDFTAFDLAQQWRSWPWQYCTQWGYIQTGNTPEGVLPVISRTIDLEYASAICKRAFNLTEPANVDAINKHGGFGISYPRLAIIDGEWDPWRAATPHALGLEERVDTLDEPFKLIAKAVHHWDENGRFPNETTANLPPSAVAEVQKAEAQFVRKWMQEWKLEQARRSIASLP
ncbi:extracellular serine carboxypeptidase [Apiospora arundinis]